jgi:hypothetical protein
MGNVHPAGRIELSDDPQFTKKSWIAERVGWGFLGFLLLAAVLGVLGPGLFSSRTAAGRSLTVEYDRFGNFKTEATMVVRLSAGPEDGGRVALWIDRKYLDEVSLQEILPLPLETRSGQDRTVYVFAAPPDESRIHVRFRVVPEKPGRLAGRLGRENESVDVRQFIYP